MWVMVIHNLVTNEVDVCGLDHEHGAALELANAYILTLEKTRSDFKSLQFAITKPRPIAAFVQSE